MPPELAEERKAMVVKQDGKTQIFIGNLHIELVEEDDTSGPLGWENGQEPGVIFWRNDLVKKEEKTKTFKHGKESPVTSKKLRKSYVKKMRELI